MGILIDDLLTFSRMGRSELQLTNMDLNILLEEAISGQPDLHGRNVEWKKHPLPVVKGDPALLRQVFINLISNALKYTRPRNPATIEIGCREDDPKEITIFVRDNGVGFEPEYAHKLFGVFQRLHDAENFEGTGIGLAIVRRVITRHHGHTWAEGAPDQGATFYFSLPKSGI
jgi:light-regulated signal transduction histidine kinase (bacteriophytochrome)